MEDCNGTVDIVTDKINDGVSDHPMERRQLSRALLKNIEDLQTCTYHSALDRVQETREKMIAKWGEACLPHLDKMSDTCPKCGSGGAYESDTYADGCQTHVSIVCDDCHTWFRLTYVSLGITAVEFNDEDEEDKTKSTAGLTEFTYRGV